MILFRVKRTIKLGVKSLWMHLLRSILTALGIIFGVSSVIAMLAIGAGASRHAQEQIARLGSRNIIVKTIKPSEEQDTGGQEQSMSEYGLTYDDAERFRNSIPGVQVVVPIRRLAQRAWFRNRKVGVEVVGTVPWYPEMSPLTLRDGRFLSSIDMHHRQAVCVIDENVVEKLFAFYNPFNQYVKIASDYYRVIGVVSPKSFDAAENSLVEEIPVANPNPGAGANVGNIYIPLTTAKNRFGEISIQFSGQSGRNIEKVQLQEIIVKVRSIEEVLPTRDNIEGLMARFHKKPDYQVVVPLELLRQAARTKRIFSIVLGSIAAISLLVGGIGIMNIMLATVSERTREIGIRRALGAKKHDIIVQFLSETLLLTFIGGIIGMILGCIIPFFVTYFGNMPTVITGGSLLLAFCISGAVGVTFGLYPAYRAANMDPIESLRHE